MVDSYPKSIDKEAAKAFKKVKFDIEELRRMINNKQDKQANVFVEMNNMRSELKIEFREELLELQKAMTKEMDALRKEVLYYRDLCEQHRMDHHKVKVIERRIEKIEEEPIAQPQEESFKYERVVEKAPREEAPAQNQYKEVPKPQEFNEVSSDSSAERKKTYLRWITIGDSDLDSIDEVIVK